MVLQPVFSSVLYVSGSNAAALAALPCLTHLSAAGLFVAWSSLAASPSLTSIHARDNEGESYLPQIQALSRLRHLSLVKSGFAEQSFGRFFTDPNLLQLVTLTFEGLHCGLIASDCPPTITPAEYSEVFKQLSCLRLLDLRRCIDIQAMLPHLAHCAQLTQLTIEPHWDRDNADCLGALFELLCVSPHLSCEVLLHSFHSAESRAKFAAFPDLPDRRRRYAIREVPGATVQPLFQPRLLQDWTQPLNR